MLFSAVLFHKTFLIVKDSAAFNFDGTYGQEYDNIAQRAIPAYDQLFQMTLSLFQTYLDREAHVLIVGCGTGRELETLAMAQSDWRFTGVDPSHVMIETTRQLAEQLSIIDRVTLHHGITDSLSESRQFDAATIINVMHFLTDDGAKDDLVRSVVKRVRSGAPVVLFDLHGAPDGPHFNRLMQAWIHFMDIRGLQGEAQKRLLQRLQDGIVYVSERRILEICADAGLVLQMRYIGGLLYGGWLFQRSG